MTSRVEIETKLREARAAYHALMTGTLARVVVDQNGERVEFAASNQGKLYSYIQQLELELGRHVGSPMQMGGPARFLF